MRTTFILNNFFLTVVLLSSVRLEAQVVPDRWEKLDATVPGTEIIVRLQTGLSIEGTFQGSTPDDVTVITDAEIEMNVAKLDVVEVTSASYEDSNAGGTLIGLGTGLAFGVAVGHSFDCSTRARCESGYGGVFGGIGALIGYLVDDRIKGSEILYRSTVAENID